MTWRQKLRELGVWLQLSQYLALAMDKGSIYKKGNCSLLSFTPFDAR